MYEQLLKITKLNSLTTIGDTIMLPCVRQDEILEVTLHSPAGTLTAPLVLALTVVAAVLGPPPVRYSRY